MEDGKPLLVSIHEKKGALFLEFIKTQEGLSAESVGVICKTGALKHRTMFHCVTL